MKLWMATGPCVQSDMSGSSRSCDSTATLWSHLLSFYLAFAEGATAKDLHTLDRDRLPDIYNARDFLILLPSIVKGQC